MGDLLEGSFGSHKGKDFSVGLEVVKPDSVSARRVPQDVKKSLSGYEKLQLSDLKISFGRREVVQGRFTIQWFRESRSGLSMFHVVDGYPKTVIDSMNDVIDKRFYLDLAIYFGCSDGLGGSGIELSNLNYFLSEDFVSYSVMNSWYCAGAAHPDFGSEGTTLSAKTGNELVLEDIYWVGEGVKPTQDSDAWMYYRSKVFAPHVVALFKDIFPAEMSNSYDEDGCDYSDAGVWSFPSWYLTAKGLYIGAYFARAQRACDNPEWSIIPYPILKERAPTLFYSKS